MDTLEASVGHVSKDVIGDIEVDTVVATDRVDEKDRVARLMADGVFTATPLVGDEKGTTGDSPPDDGDTH